MKEVKLEEGRIIPATYDPVFKALLTSEECREYLADLINIVTKIPKENIINNLVIRNSEHMKSNISEKGKTSDLIVDVENNRINLECNLDYYEGLFSKNNAYQYKLVAEQFLVGQDYIEEKKIIQINFDMFTRFDEREIIKFVIMDPERQIVETEKYEKYHVNLDLIYKLYYNEGKELSNDEKKLLLLAVDNKKILENIVKGDIVMEKAKNKLVDLSEDSELIGMYDKEIVDRKVRNTMLKSAQMEGEKLGLEKGFKKGHQEGLQLGIKEGIKEGINEGINKVVINMLNNNFEVNDIALSTGLSEKEILDIKDRL